MSLKYVGETALQENIVKTKEHVESVRATLDAAKQDKIELATMPQASEDNLGLVVIYTGSTTSTYTHGYMYECVSYGETPATYSWEQLTSDVKIDNTTIVKDAYTGELSAALATTHSLGIVKGGDGINIESTGEITVVSRLEEASYLPRIITEEMVQEKKCYLLTEEQGSYKKGGIYQATGGATYYAWLYGYNAEFTASDPPSVGDTTYAVYDGKVYVHSMVTAYDEINNTITIRADEGIEYTRDETADEYGGAQWELISANSQEFNTDDFEIENNVVSLDVTQRSFTGTQAEWDVLTTAEKKTYGTVNITDDESTANFDVYSTVETKTNKVWIDGKPIYRRVFNVNNINTTTTAAWVTILQDAWIEDIDIIVSCTIIGTFGSSTNGKQRTLSLDTGIKDDILKVYTGYTMSVLNNTCVLEYTKNTD